ncbi:BON domain-containing protein [Planctomicrobium piriforme]|uniref:BON domain-containing protein n=1 Tax=Planctomicrobium piriforme TaxID=1576369 RepID=A0A1I3S3H7_9PLAN|nr:BON domain-containing protein [Planctomicrobium piriforme]SFJ53185.1 hypothetical protein SAMN05421753_1234 [Planctomicrobium piriforme]
MSAARSPRDAKNPSGEPLPARVTRILQDSHPAFRSLTISEESGAIIIDGHLPSYYLKQVVQTTAARVDGVLRLENRVEVVRISA